MDLELRIGFILGINHMFKELDSGFRPGAQEMWMGKLYKWFGWIHKFWTWISTLQ